MCILIVIPCLNEAANIERIVTQLLRTNTMPSRIVIADGDSTDASMQIAERLSQNHDNVFYLRNPKRVQSAGVNLAVARYGSDADYLLRIDGHAEYPDDYCKHLLEEASARNADSVVVSMNTVGKTKFQKAVALAQNSRLGNGGSAHRSIPHEGKWVDHGHHALIPMKTFRAIRGYAEAFSPNEDAEMDIRLGKAGYKIWLTAKTNLLYYPRTHPIALWKQYYCYGAARYRTFFRHRVRLKLRQLLPLFLAPSLVVAIASPWCAWLALPLCFWALACIIYGVLLESSLSGLAAMIMHLA